MFIYGFEHLNIFFNFNFFVMQVKNLNFGSGSWTKKVSAAAHGSGANILR